MLGHGVEGVVADIDDGDAVLLAIGLVDHVGARRRHRDQLELRQLLQRVGPHRHLVDDGDGRVLEPLEDLLRRPGRFVFFVAVRKVRLAHIGADQFSIEEHDLRAAPNNPLDSETLPQASTQNAQRLAAPPAHPKADGRGPAKLVGETGSDPPLSPRARDSLFGSDLLDLRLHAVAEMRLRRRRRHFRARPRCRYRASPFPRRRSRRAASARSDRRDGRCGTACRRPATARRRARDCSAYRRHRSHRRR